ncbi:MAG: AmmeMemoRadiSam system radical SAM enzyme [Candidatus Omnitrophota bacterium]|nr:MAG: AmmeMemoRadiSam system radical SAM enzyme [Candidatus Omnitrophota bacterium]
MKKEAMLYEKLGENKIHCYLCSHHCRIGPSGFGICGVRQNIDGVLYTHVYGEAIAHHIDPIEKKPLYHFFPGSEAYSIATVGCNFKCGFCQNWQISQVSYRDGLLEDGYALTPEKIVQEARKHGCKSISYTYTEPTIFFEYAFDTAYLAKQEGLYNNFVTNGYMTKETLEAIHPYLDACNVDLKSFREEFYRDICKAHLQPVLDSIRLMKKLNIWVEITTLVVPGQNDSDTELANIAQFIASVGKEIPWHITRFHPNYQFTDQAPTPLETLKETLKIGKQYGLRYIYLGNVSLESDIHCYNCRKPVIKRTYSHVEKVNIKQGKCSFCGTKIDGVW